MADEPRYWSSPTDDEPPAAPTPPTGWGGSSQGPPAQSGAYGNSWSAPAGWGGPALGAPKPGVIPLRPLGLGEILDGAVSVVRRYPVPTLGLSAVVAVVTTVATIAFLLLVPDATLGTSVDPSAAEFTDAQIGGTLLGLLGTVLVALIGTVVLSGFITAVMGRAVLGRDITLGEAWQQVRPRIWALLGATLLVSLLASLPVLVAAVLLVVGLALQSVPLTVVGGIVVFVSIPVAVFLYVRLALATPALILEKASIRASLRRSWALVKGAFWRTFGILVLASVIASVLQGILQVPFIAIGALAVEPSSVLGVILTSLGGGIATAIVGPFAAGVTALLYLDRRMRAEGLDVTLTAAANEGR